MTHLALQVIIHTYTAHRKKHMAQRKLENRKHIVYTLEIAGELYVGCTNVEAKLGVERSLQRRVSKHWYRLKDPKRSQWTLYERMRTLNSKGDIIARVVSIHDNKAEGHTAEQQLLKQLTPALNSDI